jgi:hypothetical protein
MMIVQMKSMHLADKASQLVATLQDQAARLKGTELQQTVDKVIE